MAAACGKKMEGLLVVAEAEEKDVWHVYDDAAQQLVPAERPADVPPCAEWMCLNPLCPRNIDKNGQPVPYWERMLNVNGLDKDPECEECGEEMTPAQKDTRGRKLADSVRELVREDNKQLLLAVQRGDVAGATRLIEERGADVDVLLKWEDGCTPLHHAARMLHLPMATLLLEHGASPNIKDHAMGFTPLFHAVRAGRYSATVKESAAALAMAELLLAKGAETHHVDHDGNNVRYWAKQLGNDKFLRHSQCPEQNDAFKDGASINERMRAKQAIMFPPDKAAVKKAKGGKKK